MKKLLISISVFALLLSGNSVFAKPFSDVSIYHENYVAIEFLEYLDAVNGYADGTYKPAASINRAEFTKILIEGFYSTSDIEACTEESFKDVKSTDWFAKHVCLAKKVGAVSGYSDGTFKPGNNINTAEAYKIVMALAMIVDTGYVDETGPAAEWYEKYLNYAYFYKYNHVQTVDPVKNLTRGEMAQLIYLVTNGEHTKIVQPNILYGYYSYYDDSFLEMPAQNGYLVLFFTKDDCQKCKESDQIILENIDLIPMHLAIVKVKDNEELVKKYDIDSFPTYVQVDEKGEVLARWKEGSLGTIAARAPYAYEKD